MRSAFYATYNIPARGSASPSAKHIPLIWRAHIALFAHTRARPALPNSGAGKRAARARRRPPPRPFPREHHHAALPTPSLLCAANSGDFCRAPRAPTGRKGKRKTEGKRRKTRHFKNIFRQKTEKQNAHALANILGKRQKELFKRFLFWFWRFCFLFWRTDRWTEKDFETDRHPHHIPIYHWS